MSQPATAPPAMSRRPAIYGRTSTTSRQDLDGQLEFCRRAAGPSALEFTDKATSSTVLDRLGITELMAAAKAGKLEKVYISELSRIGRSIGFITRTVEQLSALGVKVVLAKTGTVLDPITLEGRALLGGLALAADIELALIQERNARGRETIRRKGIKTGRTALPVSDRVIRSLAAQGLSHAAIAKETGVSRSTITRRCKMLGIRTSRTVTVPDSEPARNRPNLNRDGGQQGRVERAESAQEEDCGEQ